MGNDDDLPLLCLRAKPLNNKLPSPVEILNNRVARRNITSKTPTKTTYDKNHNIAKIDRSYIMTNPHMT